jgi:HEAT repeat protein
VSPVGRKARIARLTKRGDVARLVRLLAERDWLVDRDGVRRDLAVGRRLEVVAALGAIDGPEAEGGLLVAMTDEQPQVRLAAVDALPGKPTAETAEMLAREVAGWRDPAFEEARVRALDILSAQGDPTLGAVYAETLIEGAHAELTTEEIAAIRQIFAIPGSHDVATALASRIAQRLGDDRPCIRQSLSALGEPAVPAVVEALSDPSRRRAAAEALGEIRSARAVEPLLALLSAEDSSTRAVAARALGRIRDPRALDGLVRAGVDADAEVRDAALDAIDRLGAVVAALGGSPSVERLKASNTADVTAEAAAGRTEPAAPAADPSGTKTEPEEARATPRGPNKPRHPTLRGRLIDR